EVTRRQRGGTRIGDDSDPATEINVVLQLAGDERIWPVQRAIKRCSIGDHEGIAIYGAALGLDVGPRPPREDTSRYRLARASERMHEDHDPNLGHNHAAIAGPTGADDARMASAAPDPRLGDR